MYNDNNEFRSVKRAHSPDSSFGDSNSNFRGPPHFNRGGGHYQHHNQHYNNNYNNHHRHNYKRHRGEIPNETIEDKIGKLGDSGSSNHLIKDLAKEIEIELSNKTNEDEKVKNIAAQICKSIISFPTRIGTYSTLIGLISVKHYNVSCQIINILHASYPVYLEAQKWNEALTIMHILADLVNCKVIQPTAILLQFDALLEAANEPNNDQKRADYFVYTIMSSLPYVAHELSIPTEPPNSFENLLTNLENYLNSRSTDHLKFTRVWLSNDSTIQMDYLDSLWVQMKNFRANNWSETFLRRPYNEKDCKDIMVSSLIPQQLPLVQIPPHSSSYIYPNPRIIFRVFEDDVVEERKSIPGSDKIERFCIENHIRNLIDEIPKDPKSLVRHLSSMHGCHQLPMKYLLIETILGELFTIPKTRHDQILYYCLLCDFPKLYQDTKPSFDSILNEAVKVLYQNLETMNVTCFSRFVEWFSFHLNNIDLVYPWITWQDAEMDKEKTSAKSLFVHEVLDRCIRFSFHKKISTMVNVSLPNSVPPEVAIKYNPVFSDHPRAKEMSDTIKKLIVERADGKLISETLNIKIDGIELPDEMMIKEENHADHLLKIDIFTATIITLAAKSLTHMSSAFGKYKNVFKALTRIDRGQIQLLQTMHSCLETHPHLQIILVDKLLKADLICAREVCNWLFSVPMEKHYMRSYPWDIMNNTVNRLKQVIRALEREIDEPVVVKAPTHEINTDKVNLEKEGSNTPVHQGDGQNGGSGDGDKQMDEVQVKQEIQPQEENKDLEMSAESQRQLEEDKRADLQVQLNDAIANLDQLLNLIFSSFVELIHRHVKSSQEQGMDPRDNWYKWFTGRMQEIYYNHYDTIQSRDDILRIIKDEMLVPR